MSEATLKVSAHLCILMERWKAPERNKIRELSYTLRCRTDQIRSWLKGTHSIHPKYARRLGRFFGVSPERFLVQWYEIDPDDSSFGTEIKRRRLQMGLSTHEFANLLGYCQKTVSNWERGEYGKTKIDEIHSLFESVKSHLPENF